MLLLRAMAIVEMLAALPPLLGQTPCTVCWSSFIYCSFVSVLSPLWRHPQLVPPAFSVFPQTRKVFCLLQVRDLRRLLELYQRWQPRVFPHCTYNQFETALEKMSGTNALKVGRQQSVPAAAQCFWQHWRAGMCQPVGRYLWMHQHESQPGSYSYMPNI